MIINPYSFGPPPDPYFANVQLLHHCEDTPRGVGQLQALLDSSSFGHVWESQSNNNGGVITQGSIVKFGSRALDVSSGGGTASLRMPYAVGKGFDVINFGTGDFTIETWAYPVNVAAKRSIFGFQATAINQFLNITNQRLGAAISNSAGGGLTSFGGESGAVGTVITTNAWHHLAVARQSGVFRGFLDGVQQWSTAFAANITQAANAAQNITLGAMSDAFSGYLDEFRVTNGVARYTGNFTVPSAAFPNY